MATTQSTPTDEELVGRARRGDTIAFEQLIERYFAMVHSIAYLRVKHREMAEDLAQEVFLTAFLHLDQVRDPRKLAAWLAQVTRNLAFHWMRKERRKSSLVTMVPLDALSVEIPDQHQEEARQHMETLDHIESVRNALFHLPAEEAEVVMLRFGENLKPPEIAARLDMHPTTARRRLKKALEHIPEGIRLLLPEAVPTFLPPVGRAIRTIRLVDAVALMSPAEQTTLGRLSAGVSEKGVWATSMSLLALTYWAYQTTPGRVVMPPKVASRRYDVTLEMNAKEFDSLYPALQKILAEESGLRAEWETQTVDAFVLAAPKGAGAGLHEPGPLPQDWRSFMKLDSTQGSEARNCALKVLVIHLEENLHCPVLDETGLTGFYDWNVKWRDGADAAEIMAQTEKTLGLTLQRVRRRVEMLVLKEKK